MMRMMRMMRMVRLTKKDEDEDDVRCSRARGTCHPIERGRVQGQQVTSKSSK